MTTMNFNQFKERVAELLRTRLSITPDDCTDDEQLRIFLENRETPEQFIEWVARKYDLDRVDQFPFTGPPSGMPPPISTPTCNACDRVVEHAGHLNNAGYCVECAKEANHPLPLIATRPNLYKRKQEARRQRLMAASDKRSAESDSRMATARRMMDTIPLGQPILVGHHSEGRDRRFRRRMIGQFEKALALDREANELRDRASSVGKGGVSSDDPEAVQKLEAELANAVQWHREVKEANAVLRRFGKGAELGLSSEVLHELARYCQYGGADPVVGFPAYHLRNLSANIRRIKQRIASLKASATRPAAAPAEVNGWRVVEDSEGNRIRVYPCRRLNAAEYRVVRQHGFVWARCENAFQRKLNTTGIYAAKRLVEALPLTEPRA